MIKKPYNCLKPDRKRKKPLSFINFEAKLLGKVIFYSESLCIRLLGACRWKLRTD